MLSTPETINPSMCLHGRWAETCFSCWNTAAPPTRPRRHRSKVLHEAASRTGRGAKIAITLTQHSTHYEVEARTSDRLIAEHVTTVRGSAAVAFELFKAGVYVSPGNVPLGLSRALGKAWLAAEGRCFGPEPSGHIVGSPNCPHGDVIAFPMGEVVTPATYDPGRTQCRHGRSEDDSCSYCHRTRSTKAARLVTSPPSARPSKEDDGEPRHSWETLCASCSEPRWGCGKEAPDGYVCRRCQSVAFVENAPKPASRHGDDRLGSLQPGTRFSASRDFEKSGTSSTPIVGHRDLSKYRRRGGRAALTSEARRRRDRERKQRQRERRAVPSCP